MIDFLGAWLLGSAAFALGYVVGAALGWPLPRVSRADAVPHLLLIILMLSSLVVALSLMGGTQ